ncbi:MAG TPA: hypothetical protein VJN96_13450 [Vicinamibacterales bacterium]|nr:hypothetical protein [Vicinamibacterales bacterium]
MRGHHLDVLNLASSVVAFAFDSEVGKLHVIVDNGQLVLTCPASDLFVVPLWTA